MSEMTCCPLSSGDEGDAPKFFSSGIITCRKATKCTECYEDIAPGARYEKVSGKWDYVISSHKTCMSCVEIRDHFACDGGWVYGQLWEDLAENFFPDMKAGGPCMTGLSPAAKQRLIDARMEWYFAQDEVDDSRWDKFKKPDAISEGG